MDFESIKFFSYLGTGGLLAAFIFIVYVKESRRWQEAWKGQSEVLIQVVKDNTEAFIELKNEIHRVRR